MLHVHCKTSVAILLAAIADHGDVLRFPHNSGQLPGLSINVTPGLPIDVQLLESLWATLGEKVKGIQIVQEFADEVTLSSGAAATLYLATLNGRRDLGDSALTMPAILRSLPKDRNRLAYLKAWQILTGSLTLNTKAVDLNEVKKHLEN